MCSYSRGRRMMGHDHGAFIVGVAALLVMFSGALAQAPVPAPSSTATDCIDSLVSISDCLTYVESGSNLTKPEKGCCPGLTKLVNTSPLCLCQILHNSSGLGIQLDLRKAMNLSTVCRLSTPSVTLCSAFGLPVGVPAPTPGPTAPAGSESLKPPSTSTPQAAPSPGGSRDASSTKDLVLVFLVVTLSTIAVALPIF